jgi:hypothetical protein
MSEHGGLFGAITEALEIQQTSGVTWSEALQLQRQQAEERLREYQQSVADNNVIQFRPRPR